MKRKIRSKEDIYISRRNSLKDAFPKSGIDIFFTFKSENIRYLSNFSGGNGLLLVTENRTLLFTDPRYGEEAAEETVGVEVKIGTNILDDLIKELETYSHKSIGFEAEEITYSQYEKIMGSLPSVRLNPTYGLVEDIRIIKDEGEIGEIKRAIDIAAKAFKKTCKNLLPGASEWDISAKLEYQIRKGGAEKTAFDFIVVSGERGSLPHGIGTKRRVETGEMITIDFGAKYNGYHSDCTRTLPIGDLGPKEAEIYNIVLSAQMEAIKGVKAGVPAKDIDKIARDIIEDAGYGEFFGHGTGHGVGLEVHESPRVSAKSDTILKAGMVITVEPGIYIPGWGGARIEDMILVTKEGCEILTSGIPKANLGG
ncbi:MAG: aminopeptidase P family protein [Nitrospinae bacterium]|nr:aminopeptidase P family protein [Nitrospinota bacterium]